MTSGIVKEYGYNESRPWSEFDWRMFAAIVALHLGAAVSAGWHIWQHSWPSPAILATALVLYVISGLGITMGYHRYFTHEGFTAHPMLRSGLMVAAALALEGSAVDWVSAHWRHHAKSDRPGDPHSPYQYDGLKGVLWGHVGWLFYKRHLPEFGRRQTAALNSPLFRWQHRNYGWLVLASLGLPAVIGGLSGGWSGAVDGLFFAGFLRIVVLLNFTWSINSICHLVGRTVSVKFRGRTGVMVERHEGDGSRNVWWLGPFTFGESYHALHHLFDRVAFHGWNWWNLDVTKWSLLVLERLRLVWGIERPPAQAVVSTDPAELPADSLIHRYRPVPVA